MVIYTPYFIKIKKGRTNRTAQPPTLAQFPAWGIQKELVEKLHQPQK